MMRREMDPRAAGDVSPSASSPSEQHDLSLSNDFYASQNQSSSARRASPSAFSVSEQQTLPLFPTTAAASIVQRTPPSDESSSPESLIYPHGEVSMNGFLTSHGAPAFSSHSSPHHNGSSIGSEQAAAAVQGFDQPSMGAFVPFTTAMGMEPAMAHVGSFHAELLGVDDVPQLDNDLIGMPSSPHQQGQASSPGSVHSALSAISDVRFKSPPPPSNIAIRRNKGNTPAMLNPTAFRAQTGGPKTGVDVTGKRMDGPAPMRRIASATGLHRVQKPGMPAAPRSPLYFERSKEVLLHSLQTATTAVPSSDALHRSLSNNVSPVMPSEALATVPRGVADALIGSSSSDDEQLIHYGSTPNPHIPFFGAEVTLKTPPPGAWAFAPQDEALLTPGLQAFVADEFSMLQTAAPTYILNSQPPTPSVTQPLGHGYFPMRIQQTGVAPGQPDYTFPGEAYAVPDMPARSSPSRFKNKQFQFTPNVTPQDFSSEK